MTSDLFSLKSQWKKAEWRSIPKYSTDPKLDRAIKYYRYLLRTDASYDRIKEARSEILALEGTV
jgi:hypothetical protein